MFFWCNSHYFVVILILGYDVAEQKSEVIMFFVEDDFEVCVNTLLVETGLASSSGPGYIFFFFSL